MFMPRGSRGYVRPRFTFVATILLMLATSLSAYGAVEVELHNTPSTDDDFLCWSPVKARVRQSQSPSSPVAVRIAGSITGEGRIQFSAQDNVPITSETYSPQNELDAILPGDGDWLEFMVSGANASNGAKDVSIQISDASSGHELASLPVMVRVRKNASNLSQRERGSLLEALATLNGHRQAIPSQRFEKYANAHGVAFEIGIHNGDLGWPLFLAWHRAFLLSLERELQQIDPTVAIPYWRFDEDNTNLFTLDFLGTVSSGSSSSGNIVQFSTSNPLLGWRMTSGGALVRDNDSTMKLQNVFPSHRFEVLDLIMQEVGSDVYGGTPPAAGINSQLERLHHNWAHVSVSGWLGSGRSPRDPLFFLLHANVDRAWAEWQARLGRFDSTEVATYSAQGTYPGSGGPLTLRKSSYGEDVMWPWSQEDGSSTPSDLQDDWPSEGFAFRPSPSGYAPVGGPTPASMIDYLGTLAAANSIGVCYDHIDYFGEVR